MKYWIGKKGTNKEGQYGSMDDNGYVPDSKNLEKSQYDEMISNIEILPKEDSDIEKLIKYAKKEKWIE